MVVYEIFLVQSEFSVQRGLKKLFSHRQPIQHYLRNIKEWRISLGGSYLAWPFPPSVAILTSRDHSHLAWQFSPRVTIPTLRGNSHLAWPFLPGMAIFTSHDHSHLVWQFSARMTIPTSRTYSHLACPLHHSKSPRAHLKYTFSPRVHILTSHTYSHLACSPPPKIISFTTHGKIPKKVMQQPQFHQ